MASARLIQLLGKVPLISTALRWYAHKYRDGSVVIIRSGYAKGMLWQRYRRYVNGYWIGQYELPIQEAVAKRLRQGDVFYDIGANAGFFSLIASRIVGPFGKCVSFDPDPVNIESISQQIKLNGITNWIVVQEAVSDGMGRVAFSRSGPGASTGHLGEARRGEESIEVRATTLDEAARRFGSPNFVKMDVEGEEGRVLKGAARLLREDRPVFLIELHGPACKAEAARVFAQARYELYSLNGTRLPHSHDLPHHILAARTV